MRSLLCSSPTLVLSLSLTLDSGQDGPLQSPRSRASPWLTWTVSGVMLLVKLKDRAATVNSW